MLCRFQGFDFPIYLGYNTKERYETSDRVLSMILLCCCTLQVGILSCICGKYCMDWSQSNPVNQKFYICQQSRLYSVVCYPPYVALCIREIHQLTYINEDKSNMLWSAKRLESCYVDWNVYNLNEKKTRHHTSGLPGTPVATDLSCCNCCSTWLLSSSVFWNLPMTMAMVSAVCQRRSCH